MRVVQTEISETEHALLEAYVKARGMTIKEAVRGAIRRLAMRDEVDPADPIFTAFPLTRKKGALRDAAEDHDRYLYKGTP